MACAHYALKFERALDEFVPPALLEAECLLRKSNPEKWNQSLHAVGVDVEPEDYFCTRNLEGDWVDCPLFVQRKAQK